MDKSEIRLKNLEKWFEGQSIPKKDRSFISQLRKGATFGERAARRIEQDYGMPSFYLDSDPELEALIVSSISTTPSDAHRFKIELLDVQAKAGVGGIINNEYPEVIQAIYFSLDGLLEIVGRKTDDGLFMINIPTDSMSPTIDKGDVVFVDTNVRNYYGEGIYIFAIDNEVYIKRLQKIPGGTYRALSDNKNYDPFDITEDVFNTAIVIGKFVRVLPIDPRDL
ncbi:S24 family peptidase [uncultured Haemophilus sp.]|uniref:S24 family peptidase n=1 Tax=uncultured Haemophilus sp. TaxID=237779 RepID=UPI00258CACC7|nr:S24 family peptidase [uncultured Haemophilus sp.]